MRINRCIGIKNNISNIHTYSSSGWIDVTMDINRKRKGFFLNVRVESNNYFFFFFFYNAYLLEEPIDSFHPVDNRCPVYYSIDHFEHSKVTSSRSSQSLGPLITEGCFSPPHERLWRSLFFFLSTSIDRWIVRFLKEPRIGDALLFYIPHAWYFQLKI